MSKHRKSGFSGKSSGQGLGANEPLRHAAHKRPVTRRDFLAQGFLTGAGMVTAPSLMGLLAGTRNAEAAISLSPDITALKSACGLDVPGGGKIPFICFDLAGGANMVGSNVLVGGQGGYLDNLVSTAGYSKMGIPGDMVPGGQEATPTATSAGNFTDITLGLPFHSDSAYLRGILDKIDVAATASGVNGAVIPARSDNDSGNNPHNPMYGIFKAGANGELLSLVGSRSSESGGNSIAPPLMVDPSARPTKVDRPSDVTGLVDTGKLVGLLSQQDAVAVMESIQRISNMKMGNMPTKLTPAALDAVVQDLVRCGYVKSADLVARFGDPSALDPEKDTEILGASGIFSQAEWDGNDSREFRKTASVMKMVVDGYAGAGTIQMGGFDYHTGDRSTGEVRDLRAGRCMGACLEYAKRKGKPLMIYVFSDGSVASNGTLDNSANGRGKGVWTGDNSSTAASFFLVYNPGRRPTLLQTAPDGLSLHKQIGWFRTSDGSVETGATPAANNVNLLVETLLLNYMALHGEQGRYGNVFGNNLGDSIMMDSLTAFTPIVDKTIDKPV
ncbi:MAG: general secretion pathway protein GspF [Gammaproteobacteria bacterium]|nr:general secretion pathway protein GspF [Gammaproteobacteria bacterium]